MEMLEGQNIDPKSSFSSMVTKVTFVPPPKHGLVRLNYTLSMC